MYDPLLLQDLHLTHSITNYLLAAYQGKFASFNILSQLGYPKLDPSEGEVTEKAFDQITRWNNALWDGAPLLSTTWEGMDSFDAERASKLLQDLVPELARASQVVRGAVAQTDLASHPEGVMQLLAAYGRYAYSQDNYIRGFVKFAEVFQLQEMFDAYSKLVPEHEAKVQLAHTFLNVYLSEAPDEGFYSSLISVCRILPGKFRMYIHDINQLCCFYDVFTYEKAGIDSIEQVTWEAAGIGPDLAGYWVAFDTSAEIARQWVEIGVTNPELASSWEQYNFNPTSTAQWLRFGFPPGLAAQWAEAGFDAQSSYSFFLRGIQTPAQIPKDDDEAQKPPR